MSLQDELLKLAQDIEILSQQNNDDILLMHAKSHMYHNQRMHDKIILEMNKRNMQHIPFDALDK